MERQARTRVHLGARGSNETKVPTSFRCLMKPLPAKFRDEISVTGGWCDTRQFSVFKSQRLCNDQLLYGNKSRESQRNKFNYINLQFQRYDTMVEYNYVSLYFYTGYKWNARMFYVGYINILDTRNIFGNNYKTRGFINFCMQIPSHISILLYLSSPSVR